LVATKFPTDANDTLASQPTKPRRRPKVPCAWGIPWLGFVVHPTHRKLRRRNAVNFTRRLAHNLDLYEAGLISFAELDAGVQG
jgi:hypothetical protein